MWRLLVLLLFLPVRAVAQGFPELPARFVRVYTLEELQGTGFYALGAINNGGLHFMRQTLLSSPKEKLDVTDAVALQEAYTLTKNINFWKIEKTSAGWTLQGETGTYLSPKGNNNFTFGVAPTTWTFASNDDGTFSLWADTAPDYFVSVSAGTQSLYFSRYKYPDNHAHLYVYKLANAEATAPTDGSAVALCVQSQGEPYAVGGTTPGLQTARGYLLANDTIAPDESITTWSVNYFNETDFALTSGQGENLCVNNGTLTLSPATGADGNACWRVDEGLITWVGNPSEPLVLCAARETGQTTIRLLSPLDYEQSGAAAFLFRPIGTPPTATRDSLGVLRLSGAWSATALTRLAARDITALDLTQISLPRHAAPLVPENPNTLVYVRAHEADYAPQDWPHVVTVSNQGNQAVRPVRLIDKYPFHTPYPFDAAQGISYEREALTDGGWETLCLPFDVAQLPLDFAGEACAGVQGAALRFTPVQSVKANTPVIFTYVGHETADTVPFQVQATGVEVSSMPSTATADLKSNYQHLTVGEREGSCYLLNAAGDAFVLSDATSTLAPFRAYLETTARKSRMPIRHTTTSAMSPTTPNAESGESYTIDGRRQPAHSPARTVYIRNGKKYIQQ